MGGGGDLVHPSRISSTRLWPRLSSPRNPGDRCLNPGSPSCTTWRLSSPPLPRCCPTATATSTAGRIGRPPKACCTRTCGCSVGPRCWSTGSRANTSRRSFRDLGRCFTSLLRQVGADQAGTPDPRVRLDRVREVQPGLLTERLTVSSLLDAPVGRHRQRGVRQRPGHLGADPGGRRGRHRNPSPAIPSTAGSTGPGTTCRPG